MHLLGFFLFPRYDGQFFFNDMIQIFIALFWFSLLLHFPSIIFYSPKIQGFFPEKSEKHLLSANLTSTQLSFFS